MYVGRPDSDGGAARHRGTSTFNTGVAALTLNIATNSFAQTVTLTSSGNASLVNVSATDLGASTITGNLTVSSAGAITESGAVSVTGATSLTTTGSNASITLNTANTLGGSLSLIATGGVSLANNTTITGKSYDRVGCCDHRERRLGR